MRSVEEILAENRLWTVAEAARFLSMSESWIYKRAEDGTLPVVVIGNRVRFDPTRLREYVQRCSSGAGASSQSSVVSLGSRRG